MRFNRSSGILLHITSLPSPYGIGDMGPSAFQFIDFLKEAGQKYWQLLPLNPTQLFYGNSPYSSPSAFAGNLLLISPEMLVKERLLTQKDIKPSKNFDNVQVNFEEVTRYKSGLLDKAFGNFKKQATKGKEFELFCTRNKSWLNDHALFMSLKSAFKNTSWTAWPEAVRNREQVAIAEAKENLAIAIEREKFFQFIFFSQWQRLKEYCHQQGIKLIGDIPFYVNHDSADCWANTRYFKLDAHKDPIAVSGVPPDYFSETGQLWGTPVYDWRILQQDGFSWWIARIEQNLLLFDIVRLDHFRAFSACWEVPAGDDTAVNGKWAKVPGTSLFRKMREKFPLMPFIAEDLGTLDQRVVNLRDRFKLPGMKVLLFSFGDNMSQSPYIPHYHIRDSIVYTGTHDNSTVKGWYQHAGKEEKSRLNAYVGQQVTVANVAGILHRTALMSVAGLVVLPVQDILGLGEEAIMNRPGTGSGNWTWRLLPRQLTPALAVKLKSLNALYDR